MIQTKRLLLISVFTCACLNMQGQVNIITTVAGMGVSGYSPNGTPAISAQLDHPDRIIFDASGNMYIADEHNHVVRKVNTSGVISTIAGTGFGAGTLSGGYTGDSGPATDAKLSRPSDLAFDNSANLYITEAGNGTIRKVTPSGIITTIAGTGTNGYGGDNGPATLAKLFDPFGLVFDNTGNLYFADNGNRRVRKINTLGVITTIAGNGTAGYTGDGFPATAAQIRVGGYLAISSSGELYIADYLNHVIRKVDAAGIITTVVGNGTTGSGGDGGSALSASLTSPFATIFDQSGNMYISDRLAYVIRKVNIAGTISTIAGTGVAGYGGDGNSPMLAQFNTDVLGSAFDAAGNLYIADPVNNRIRKITYSTAVNRLTKEIESKLYPNPTKGVFTIQTPVGIAIVSIYNIAGVRVYERTCTTTETEIDVTTQPPGVYMVYVQCGEGKYVSKMVRE